MRCRGTLCEKKQQDFDQWPSRIAIFSPKASVEGVIGSQKKKEGRIAVSNGVDVTCEKCASSASSQWRTTNHDAMSF
ncbi:hypothetical protein COCC4DRAFT_32378 [Bipolaris maydis ATCC 48331]|uniref:Uncharacterized protein n=2 Tax=Cochliobolus heterostrophus TaxID=5016 RepID=M2UYV4_COCH5|nr:uncharacterized protein COCC4DRAFT_32378 [Bipolaris maydis ATCC 48331]EMD92912.1 hypothetical protein COCHEDRAFT_1020807 [Bipolaris maydis C5]ENI04702.1 hypothetical protein COCC4DRAFT_32378 [Bipolaris maydis ATCC 48331]